jgi:hypothetical protein
LGAGEEILDGMDAVGAAAGERDDGKDEQDSQ